MKLNPVTALSDQLQKLITEHGSATILRDHLALFKDQVIDLEKKLAISDSQIQTLQTENANLKTKLNRLESDNAELKKKIKEYENPDHDIHLTEMQLTILKLLFSSEKLTTQQIATSQQLQLQTAKYHLEELASHGMVKLQSYSEQVPGLGPFHPNALHRYSAWIIRQPGRKFLIANGYVS